MPKEKSKDDKNNLKFSKFCLILRIFKWRIENQSVLELTRKLWNWSGDKYVVPKFLMLFLKKFRSGSQELSSRMSSLYPVNCISVIQSLETHIQPYFLHLRSFCSFRASR